MTAPGAPTGAPTDAAALERAWGWVAHLRDGGTAPWASWSGSGEPTSRWLPGAQQLELLRRVNMRARPSPGLVERVLSSSAPGRGRPDLELVGAESGSRFGPRPVDPAQLPASELLRVATMHIAEDLVAAGPPQSGRARRPRFRRPRYRLAGDPWLAEGLRSALVADGRPPGGPRATVHVLGADVATMLADAWTAAAFSVGGPPWPAFVVGLRRRGRVARRVDLPTVAERWRRMPGPAGVDVVLDLDALPRLLGLRRRLPHPAPLAAHAVDLARQTAAPLGLLVLPELRADLLRGVLRPRLATIPGPPVSVPPEHRRWVAEQAADMRRRLAAGGYPVVGELERLIPRWADATADTPADTGTHEPDPARVLDVAIELLLEPAGRKEVPT